MPVHSLFIDEQFTHSHYLLCARDAFGHSRTDFINYIVNVLIYSILLIFAIECAFQH